MTAVRCTMSDTMYIGRTTGQLVRIALRSLRNGRSAPISPTGVHVCPLVRSKPGLVLHQTNMRNSDDVRKKSAISNETQERKMRSIFTFHGSNTGAT